MKSVDIAAQAVQILVPHMATIATRGIDFVQDAGAHVVAELVADRLRSSNHSDAWKDFGENSGENGAIVTYLLKQQIAADGKFEEALAKAVANASMPGHSAPGVAATIMKNRAVEGTRMGWGARINQGDVHEGDRNNRGTVLVAIVALLVVGAVIFGLTKAVPVVWHAVHKSSPSGSHGSAASPSASGVRGHLSSANQFGGAQSAYMTIPSGWQDCHTSYGSVAATGCSARAGDLISIGELNGDSSATSCTESGEDGPRVPVNVPADVASYLASLVPNVQIASRYGTAQVGTAFLYLCFGPLPHASSYLQGFGCFEVFQLTSPSDSDMYSGEAEFWKTVKTAKIGTKLSC